MAHMLGKELLDLLVEVAYDDRDDEMRALTL